MLNVLDTVISQYATAPALLQLIDSFNQQVDPSIDFQAFYDLVWNLDTAVGYGLDIWGRIVGVPRVLPTLNSEMTFGFKTGHPDFAPFGQAPFSDGVPLTSNYRLSDEAFRTLIYVKAAANIAACSAPTINQLLSLIFAGRGRCYCQDLGGMRMSYVFEFHLAPFELAILNKSNALPRPSGVTVTVIQTVP